MIKLNKKHTIDFSRGLDPHSKKWNALTKPSDGEINVCKVCNLATTLLCPRCLITPYCCQKHLNQDKTLHFHVCGQDLPYVLNEDPNGSFHYLVNNNITQGTQILIDDVPVVLPTLPEEYQEDVDKPLYHFSMICFGCHQHFYPGEKLQVCSGCGIPKCSTYCEGPNHNTGECEILKAAYGRTFNSFQSSSRKYVELYLDICVLRVLRSFLHGDSNVVVAERYRKFTMLATRPRFKQFNKMKKDSYDGISYLRLNKSVDRLYVSLAYTLFNREVVQKVFKTMIVFWEPAEVTPGVMSRLLFLDRHFMVQSYCSPNIGATIIYDPTTSAPTWITYTIKEINVVRDGNVPLLFDFSPSRFMSLPLRMEYFNNHGYTNHCKGKGACQLCNDPTDGGTNTGSITCFKCCRGLYIEGGVRGKDLLLNEFPTRWTSEYVETVDWQCNKCGDVQPFSIILEVNRKFERIYFDQIQNRFGGCRLSDICKFVNSCEKYLHESNGVILRAKYDFVMAARAKHMNECGFTVTGVPLDSYYGEKLIMGIYKEDTLKVELFPVKWDRYEFHLTKIRTKYAADCVNYLESFRKQSPGKAVENYTDFSSLSVERILINLVNSCHLYFTNPSSGAAFKSVGRTAAKIIQEFYRKCLMLFGSKLLRTDPCLKWPAEMKCFGDLIDRDSDPKFLARLILQRMRLTEENFTLQECTEPKIESEAEAEDNDCPRTR